MRVVWNKVTKKYDGYDIHSNIQLTEQQFIDRADINYNEYLNDNHPTC